jgi:hypothetical protein
VPIYRIFEREAFEPRQVECMGEAYELVLKELGLDNHPDDLTNTIAHYIIEVARTGETDAARICACVLERVRTQ